MADIFPKTVTDLDRLFPDEEACRAYLERLRWPEGFVCPKCQVKDGWQATRGRHVCRACRYQATVTAGTIFQDTRTPLRLWFHAIWQIVSQKNGASAQSVQRSLGLKSYETAWTWLHKLRRAMVNPQRERLQGTVEVDETIIGGPEPRSWGRDLGQHKRLVVIAAEESGRGIGRIRLGSVSKTTRKQLHAFIEASIEPGSLIRTDGNPSYATLDKLGYRHCPTTLLHKGKDAATEYFPRVHRVASLLKRWLMGTHHSYVADHYLDYYLDEFTFRFNRRTSRSPGKLFHRLLFQAVREAPAPLDEIVREAANHNRLGVVE